MIFIFGINPADWTAMQAAITRIDTATAVNSVLLQTIAATLNLVETKMGAIEDAITALGTQVQANTDAEASAVALITNLASLITSNANDPAAVTALAAKLKTSADALGAAIVANTPAA